MDGAQRRLKPRSEGIVVLIELLRIEHVHHGLTLLIYYTAHLERLEEQ